MKNLIVLLAAVSLFACGESDDNNHNHENHDNHEHNANHGTEVTPEADGCEHMVEGPEQAVTAAAAAADAPSITETHTRYDITIADGSGFVALEVAEEGEWHFFFDKDVTLTITDSADAAVAAEETIDSVAECSEVAEGAAYDLGVGTYVLTIETSETEVSMVPVPGDHAHEE